MEDINTSFVARARGALHENMRWGGILVVFGYVVVGFLALVGLLVALTDSDGVFGITMALFYLLVSAVYFMPVQRLNRFVKGCRAALTTDDESHVIDALHGLSRAMRLLVIYTLAMVLLYGVVILGAVLFGLSLNAFS